MTSDPAERLIRLAEQRFSQPKPVSEADPPAHASRESVEAILATRDAIAKAQAMNVEVIRTARFANARARHAGKIATTAVLIAIIAAIAAIISIWPHLRLR